MRQEVWYTHMYICKCCKLLNVADIGFNISCTESGLKECPHKQDKSDANIYIYP
jgi:hypothetical protein